MQIVKNGEITWIDISRPTKDDIEFIKKLHKFHPIILEELMQPSARSRVEKFEDYLFLTYHLPLYDAVAKTSKKSEIDFLITKNTIITVHYENLEPINNFLSKINNNHHYKESKLDNTGKITYCLIEEIIEFSLRQLRHIEEDLISLTEKLFTDNEEEMLRDISYTKRNIINYRVISKPQEISLGSLKENGIEFWGNKIRIYFSDLIGDHLKVIQQLENYCETIDGIEATNNELLTAKSNRIMQKFTVLAFLTFPLALITGIFNVSSVDKIVGGSFNVFLTSFLIVLSLTLIILFIFKKEKWF